MNLKLAVMPIPFPQFLNEISSLKLVLGVCLFIGGVIVFSLWKDRLFKLKEEERSHFLMYNIFGGSWLIAVFAVCGGIYFCVDSFYKISA